MKIDTISKAIDYCIIEASKIQRYIDSKKETISNIEELEKRIIGYKQVANVMNAAQTKWYKNIGRDILGDLNDEKRKKR